MKLEQLFEIQSTRPLTVGYERELQKIFKGINRTLDRGELLFMKKIEAATYREARNQSKFILGFIPDIRMDVSWNTNDNRVEGHLGIPNHVNDLDDLESFGLKLMIPREVTEHALAFFDRKGDQARAHLYNDLVGWFGHEMMHLSQVAKSNTRALDNYPEGDSRTKEFKNAYYKNPSERAALASNIAREIHGKTRDLNHAKSVLRDISGNHNKAQKYSHTLGEYIHRFNTKPDFRNTYKRLLRDIHFHLEDLD